MSDMIERARRTEAAGWCKAPCHEHMMGDSTRERIARALKGAPDDPHLVRGDDWWLALADAVLAVLPEYEQVGWQPKPGAKRVTDDRSPIDDHRERSHIPPDQLEPVYVKREATTTTACPTCGSTDPKVRGDIPDDEQPHDMLMDCSDSWHEPTGEAHP